MAVEKTLQFLRETGKLKLQRRKGWTQRGVPSAESISDHCWRTALIALLAAKQLKADAGKAVSMALLHDVPEARAGDIPFLSEWKGKARPGHRQKLEAKAARGLFGLLPAGRKYEKLWKEFEHGKSIEAKIARDADQLEMALQALEYERRYPKLKKRLRAPPAFLESVGERLQLPWFKRLLRSLEKGGRTALKSHRSK
jgi:putative hydrolase of HD superfamily